MACSTPIEVIGDDDEFDWEAAVREIDVACQNNQNPSTSLPSNSSSRFPHPVDGGNLKRGRGCKKNESCKQSMLDKFIGKLGPRRLTDNPKVEERNRECVEDGGEMPFLSIDAEAAKTWIYPVNVPLRDYQFAITKTALFSNTLVALPTGLGKTLIAAVVMYNYFRWFPEGKIVFAAPSRPLVMQQIEACHNIVGIPQEWTIDLTGQVNPKRRAFFWKSKRVFFVTPQVLEKDIQSGTCLVKYLVCLVIDEAHRALGNYSYCVAVRELMAIPVQLRILALTATPGSKHQAIQNIIDNLHISTLEYRNESDHDVSPYVHDRKIELIQVPLGQDVIDIDNWLLEVIRPYVTRLYSFGLIHNRDYQTLSPCDLLMSRDKFRQAPPLDLPNVKHGDVEACFAALITLYHIRKLLSSHGIRPAFEMLEEKLQQGSFARLMSKNEDIRKAKLLMQQSLSHGAPSPKISKMLEVLVDHFKTKDPQSSRVIIFSNFRGSVRDIMNALTHIGDLVKATEFIGQSSGKALKGQSQKVQQAVLEKFRAGGYNVIVATSIGEEGLDIMEVDLVICFDANISPLRMIQRMGRTGRKHDGRVVVLACEGSELKGYRRKQANSRAINKHLRNGGMNSFNFYSSSRMIPHCFRPEVQFIELSIEQFVRHGKKSKNEHASCLPLFRQKLTVEESNLIAKYFYPSSDIWRPSLIAFPHSQAFPSKVHKVMHSLRTVMLIDGMQQLQGLSFPGDNKIIFAEDKQHSDKCLEVETAEQCGNDIKDSPILEDTSVSNSQEEITDSKLSSIGMLLSKEEHNLSAFCIESPPAHKFLFNTDFVSVDALGKVQIMSVPTLSFKETLHSNCQIATDWMCLNSSKEVSCNLRTSDENQNDQVNRAKAPQTRYKNDDTLSTSIVLKGDIKHGKTLDGVEKVLDIPILKRDFSNEEDCFGKTIDIVGIKVSSSGNDFTDHELSPRLTNLMNCGVVPESPIDDSGTSKNKGKDEFCAPDLASSARCHNALESKPNSPKKSEQDISYSSLCARRTLISFTDDGIQTPHKKNHVASSLREWISSSPVARGCQTPLGNIPTNSDSKDWCLSSGDKSQNGGQARKLKRLRRVGDCGKNSNVKSMKENSAIPVVKFARSFSGKRKLWDDVRAFIDEEAEVSVEAETFEDEEDDQGNNSYDDSFIDDRINPTASTQAYCSRVDMMAIYRRSLLSQSPMEGQPNGSGTSSPDCVASVTRRSDSGMSLGNSSSFSHMPQMKSIGLSAKLNSESSYTNKELISSDARPCTATNLSRQDESMAGSRKRKLSFGQSGPMPAINLEPEFARHSDAANTESLQQDKIGANENAFDDDDEFYESIDLDAMEAEATHILRHQSDLSMGKQGVVMQSNQQNFDLQSSPSFDLGFW